MIEHEEKIEEIETLHVYPMQGGIFITKEEATEPVIDSTPTNKKPPLYALVSLVFFCVLLIGSLVSIPNAPVTTQEKFFHTFSLPHDLQSYTLPPVTRTGTRTIVATGKGHQDATYAHGFLTFYNGSFSAQGIPANMIFSANGVMVVTDEAVTIPAGNPPNYGQVSVSAHALISGVKGNIPAYAIDSPCCFSALKAINTEAFTGGRNARDYHMVRHQDIDRGVSSVTQVLYKQAQKDLQIGSTPDDAFIALPCTTSVATNRRVGQEAVNVTVTVVEICTGSAYSRTALQAKAQKLIHIPRDFRETSLSVHVVRTTPTSVTVLINCSLLYNPTRKGWVK